MIASVPGTKEVSAWHLFSVENDRFYRMTSDDIRGMDNYDLQDSGMAATVVDSCMEPAAAAAEGGA